MKVIVCGAGIIGVTTAFELARAGCDVTVIDRQPAVARETSAGNAGIIAPGYVTPWAAPGMPKKILGYLGKPASPVIFRPQASVAQWRWIGRWLRNCNEQSYRINKPRMQRLAYFSRERLHQVRRELQIAYNQSQGYLQLFRTAADKALNAPALAILKEAGIAHQELDADLCCAIEPALAARNAPLHGGLYLPDDEAGDCALFAQKLHQWLADAGVKFLFSTTIAGIAVSDAGRAQGVMIKDQSGAGQFCEADAVVLAAGVESIALAKPLGIDLPLYPIKGYSATFAVLDQIFAPKAAVIDEAYKTAITRMGGHVRIAGTAEVSDFSLKPQPVPCETLLKMARDWFPRGMEISDNTEFWVGRRPMTPDGPALLGPTPINGFYLNVGHGSTGWAMSLGSAKLVAETVLQQPLSISLDGLTLARYRD